MHTPSSKLLPTKENNLTILKFYCNQIIAALVSIKDVILLIIINVENGCIIGLYYE